MNAIVSSVGLALLVVTAQVSAAQDIVIGQSLSLSGRDQSAALDLRRGREACIDRVNATGGIAGRRLRLITLDDKGSAVLALENVRALVEREQAVVLLGSMGPEPNAAVLRWTEAAGVAVVGPFGGDVETRVGKWRNAFFLTANQSAEAERLVSHVLSLGWSRTAVVYSDDDAGRAALSAFEEALSIVQMKPVLLARLAPDGANAAGVAESLARSGAQVVVLAGGGAATMHFLRATTRHHLDGKRPAFLALSSFGGMADIKEAGKLVQGISVSQVLPYPRSGDLPVIKIFNAAMRSTRDAPSERGYVELEGCLSVLVIAEVLKRKPVDATRSSVLSALHNAGPVQLGGFEVNLSERVKPGSSYTDIVFVSPDGRFVR